MNKINLTEMKRKDYLKPTMKVVKLQQQAHLLAGSGLVQANRSSYGTANYGVNTDELDGDGSWEWE